MGERSRRREVKKNPEICPILQLSNYFIPGPRTGTSWTIGSRAGKNNGQENNGGGRGEDDLFPAAHAAAAHR